MKAKLLFSILFCISVFAASAQDQFSISISPSAITAVPALHSGAFAEWNGKWIFIGGRIDGLHRFQAGTAFGTYGRNDTIYVVDPVSNLSWTSCASILPRNMYEAVCSSNMEFYQRDSMLYMVGGFGNQDSTSSLISFPTLTAIDVKGLTTAVMNGTAISSFFRQLVDSNLAVAGGHIQKLDTTYYLIFGHNFVGKYDRFPGSPNFVQHYSNQVRKFTIADDGINLSITNYQTVTDTVNFHRRDLNVVPQIFPSREYGFTAFGGVFQRDALLPFLSPIDITASAQTVNSSFNQNLNQYETASMPLYDSLANYMHTIFFGGISLYTLDTVSHTLVQDTLVPFVSTISKITRNAAGNLSEFRLPVDMPALLGTNAKFVPDPAINAYNNGILNLNSISGTVHAGFIVGGIESDEPNIADVDPGSMSRPNSIVFDVYITKSANNVAELSLASDVLNLVAYPNPAHEKVTIDLSLTKKAPLEVSILTEKGELVKTLFRSEHKQGAISLEWKVNNIPPGIYLCRAKSEGMMKSVKVVVK